jgi:hypothetical protein
VRPTPKRKSARLCWKLVKLVGRSHSTLVSAGQWLLNYVSWREPLMFHLSDICYCHMILFILSLIRVGQTFCTPGIKCSPGEQLALICVVSWHEAYRTRWVKHLPQPDPALFSPLHEIAICFGNLWWPQVGFICCTQIQPEVLVLLRSWHIGWFTQVLQTYSHAQLLSIRGP